MEPLITSPSQEAEELYLISSSFLSSSFLAKAERDVEHAAEGRSDALACDMKLSNLERRVNEMEKQDQIPSDMKATLENLRDVLDVNSSYGLWRSAAERELEAAIDLRDFLSNQQTVRPDRRDQSRFEMLRARHYKAGERRFHDRILIQELEVKTSSFVTEVNKRLEVNHQRSTSSDSTSPRR